MLKKRWKHFASSNEGREIWFLHKLGYKFCEYMEDLTPLQEMFLVQANNLEYNENQGEDNRQKQELSNNLQNKIKNKNK